MMQFMTTKGSTICTFGVDTFPSFCGGRILHKFYFYSTWSNATKTEQKQMAEAFIKLLNGEKVIGYKLSEPLPRVATFTFAAVKGSSLWKLLSIKGYKHSNMAVNPNSGNVVRTTTFTRKW